MPSTSETDPTALWSRIKTLCSAGTRIMAEHDVASVLQEITDSARHVVGARYAALGILSSDGHELETFVASGVSPEEHRRIGDAPRGKGILGVLIADPRPLRLANLAEHPQSFGFPPRHPEMTSFLGVPIIGRGGPIGNLYLTEKEGRPEFSEDDENVAVMLASQAAVAVENARLYEEREQLIHDVKSMQASRDRFFAMVNHELRNAITGVYGWAELWLRKTGAGAGREAVEVYESAERANRFLEDVLDLSRLDAAKLTLQLEEADAASIVRTAIRSVEPEAKKKHVSFETPGAPQSTLFHTDPQRVQQILTNLFRNAVQHSPNGESVSAGVSLREDRVRFDVIDRGKGIEAERLPVIFDAYERAGTEEQRGTGLGLTLSRQLARLLGGDLWAEHHPGGGGHFVLELPVEARGT